MTGEAEERRQVKPDPANPRLVNGGFEIDENEDGRADGWHYQRRTTHETEAAPIGKSFVSFANDDPGDACQMLQGLALDGRRVPAVRLSAMVKYSNIGRGLQKHEQPALVVHFYDSIRRPIGEGVVGPFVGGTEWTRMSRTIRVPATAREAVVRIGLNGATGEARRRRRQSRGRRSVTDDFYHHQRRAGGVEPPAATDEPQLLHFGDAAAEYRAARESAALFDLSDRTRLEFTGSARRKFLHAYCTNAVEDLAVGGGCEAFVSSLKGRILDHVWIGVDEEAVDRRRRPRPGEAARRAPRQVCDARGRRDRRSHGRLRESCSSPGRPRAGCSG